MIVVQLTASDQIFEDIICRNYYAGLSDQTGNLLDPAPEYDCKVDPVQNELAFVSDLLFKL